MYLQHWGLENSPFRTNVDPDGTYPSAAHQEAAARIAYLVAEGRRAGVLLGDCGLGKSTLLRSVAATLTREGASVTSVDAMALSSRELLYQLASGLSASPDLTDDSPRLWRVIEDALAHHRWQGRDAVLLVDEADQAGPDLMRHLVRLAGLEANADAHWTIILATDALRLSQLDASLLQLIDLRIDLFAWTQEDTTGYLQHALVDAGRMTPVFTPKALETLHDLSEGTPRHVIRLADFALLAGAGAEVELIDEELVEHAFREIGWVPPAAVATIV